MKKIFNGVLSLAMLFSLTTSTMVKAEENTNSGENGGVQETSEKSEAVITLQDRINALPTVEEFEAKEESEQTEVYNEAEAISDAFDLLSEEEQTEVDTTKLQDLFTYFNSLVEPINDNVGDDSNDGTDGSEDSGEEQSSTVTLDLSKGRVLVKPTGYEQGGNSYEFTGTYIFTGSFTGDTAIDFSNKTDNPVTYDIVFDNVTITPTAHCTAIRVQNSEITSKITLNITNKGTSKISCSNHAVFANQNENNQELEVNITETEGSSLEMKRTDGKNNEMIYYGNSSVKINGTPVSNTSSYNSNDMIIDPASKSWKEIRKGGTYYIKGGEYKYGVQIYTSEDVKFVVEGDFTCKSINYFLVYGSANIVIDNPSNYKVQMDKYGIFYDDESSNENGTLTINGGEYIENGANAIGLIYVSRKTNLITLNNCTFTKNNTGSDRYIIYAQNIKATNCTFNNYVNAIFAEKNVELDGTTTFNSNTTTADTGADVVLSKASTTLAFGDNLDTKGKKIKIAGDFTFDEGEQRRITVNNTDIKYFDILDAKSDYAIGYNTTDKYFYLWNHTHAWTYNLNTTKNAIEAHCSNEKCYYYDNPVTATVSATSVVYTGERYSKASIENNITDVTGKEVKGITYEGINDTDYIANTVPPTNAGTYSALIGIVIRDNDKVIASINFAIAKASQNNPSGLLLTEETIKGKHDGSIGNVTTDMEYRKEGETTYTAITSETLTGLGSGTYYVRYKEQDNYEASNDTKAVITAEIEGLNVTVPTEQKGYTLTVDESLVEYNESSKITFALQDGYSKTDDFKVKVNGKEVTLDSNDEYTISDIHEDQVITVEGVDDITAPTINGLENGKTYTKTQTFTVDEPNLKEVKVDGVVVQATEGKYTLVPKNGTYTIVASDEAGNEMKITVTVSFEEVVKPTIQSKTYTGKTLTADIKSTDLYEVSKNDGGVDASKYDVQLTLKDTVNYKWKDSTEASVTVSFEITKAKATVEMKANSLTENGQQQELVTGKTSGGTLMYYVNGKWTTSVPTGKDAGTYTVKYKVDGGKNYEDIKESSIIVKINAKSSDSKKKSTSKTTSVPTTTNTYTLVPTDTKGN